MKHKNIIGLGVYTLQEAALYSHIKTHKLSRWVFGTSNYSSVIEGQLCERHLVSFYDLVQSMAIDKARENKIPLQKIRQAIEFAQKEYNVQFPLAYNHRMLLYQRDLHIELPNRMIIQASGRIKGQTLLREIVEPFIKDLHFNDITGEVEKFVPLRRYDREIVLDPNRLFGQPLVENTGYRADILARARKAEGTIEGAAEIYNVTIDDIKIAVDYMEQVKAAA